MSTTENNKLIAEFLDFVESPTTKKYWTKRSSEGFGIGELVDLKFHTDWNWLMEAVEKIESLGYDVFINTTVCRITDCGQTDFEIEEFTNNSKIEAVYNACVEFIKWYNEQKTNTL